MDKVSIIKMLAKGLGTRWRTRTRAIANIVLALAIPVSANAAPREGSGAETGRILSAIQRAELTARYRSSRDTVLGGLKGPRRFLDADSVELALALARDGDEASKQWAEQTLDSNRKLVDPAWGGIYDYSSGEDWRSPSFSKGIASQAANVLLYAYAFRVFGEQRHLSTARAIAAYMNAFLRSIDGAYLSGQDGDAPGGLTPAEYFALDDEKRRAKGLPTIHASRYADENGMAIVALTEMFLATGEEPYLNDATTAAQWTLVNRAVQGGGFRHDTPLPEPARLADTAWMGRALLGLYAATGERAWLTKAREVASSNVLDFNRRFSLNDRAAASVCQAAGVAKARQELSVGDALVAARFLNGLYRYSGDGAYRRASLDAHALAQCMGAEARGLLLAGDEIEIAPLHVTTVGGKGDPAAQALFAATRPIPALYVRREWWDRTEGALPNPDVQYPRLLKAAAFVCEEQGCSLPLYGADELTSRIARALSPK